MKIKTIKKNLKKLSINLFIVLFIVIFIRLFVFEIYYVNGDSMENTLLQGDIVLINKLHYGGRFPNSILEIPWLNSLTAFSLSSEKISELIKQAPSIKRFFRFSTVKRNDIVVLNDPMNYQYYIIKRCVAFSGDTISVKSSDLIINGNKFEESRCVKKKYVINYPTSSSISFQKLVNNLNIPYIEDRIQRNNSQKIIYMDALQKERLDLIIGSQFILQDTCDNLNLIVPFNDHFFVIGDNRSFSTDSRLFGSVPKRLIVGKVEIILFSIQKGKFRSNRFFKKIQ